MNGKVIYVDFKKQTRKSKDKPQTPGLLKACFHKIKSFFTFTTGSKPICEVSPYKEMM
ncbi:MAG: hypothetical protein GX370_05545 [Clostridia bacterium]|jgi:hypothetical protein|nr:hypothetical protein [Clostridia bacterium]